MGYCFGIEDRFNICSDSDEDSLEMCRQIFCQEWLPMIQQPKNELSGQMGQGVCVAMQSVFPIINYNSLMRYCAQLLGLPKETFPLKNIFDRVSYVVIWLIFKVFSRSKILMWTISRIIDVLITLSTIYHKNVQSYLTKKYDDKVCFEIKGLKQIDISCYKSAFEMKL